jgi:hypothetical protein
LDKKNHISRDEATLTVAHGRKIFDQALKISEDLEELKPLLALLLPTPTSDDPISQMLNLLEQIAQMQLQHQQSLDMLQSRVSAALERTNRSEPYSGSDEG